MIDILTAAARTGYDGRLPDTTDTRPEQDATPRTWRCTGCHTNVANAVVVCSTCGYDKWGNPEYDYANDPRTEHRLTLTWSDGEAPETTADAIKANSPAEALEAARTNWPDATTITLLTELA